MQEPLEVILWVKWCRIWCWYFGHCLLNGRAQAGFVVADIRTEGWPSDLVILCCVLSYHVAPVHSTFSQRVAKGFEFGGEKYRTTVLPPRFERFRWLWSDEPHLRVRR